MNKIREIWLTIDDSPAKLYFAAEVDELLHQIRRCAYGSTIWNEIEDLLHEATDRKPPHQE